MSVSQEEINKKVHELYERMSKIGGEGDLNDLIAYLGQNFDLTINSDELFKIEQQIVIEIGIAYFEKYVYEQPKEKQQKSLELAKILCQKMEKNKFAFELIGEILKRYRKLVDNINPGYVDEDMEMFSSLVEASGLDFD